MKLWTDGRTTDGRTDGRTPDHGHPISSPCEPNGSGELMMIHVTQLLTGPFIETVRQFEMSSLSGKHVHEMYTLLNPTFIQGYSIFLILDPKHRL